METEVKLTKLASCAGCGAKVGAGTLAQMLEGFKTHHDPRLIVGYDKSDDASVFVLDDHTALIQTTDFFPPMCVETLPRSVLKNTTFLIFSPMRRCKETNPNKLNIV